MIGTILPYFMPVSRENGKWQLNHNLAPEVMKAYMMRSVIPGMLFWFLSLCFLSFDILLASIFMGLTIPFAFMFGMMLREYADLRRHH